MYLDDDLVKSILSLVSVEAVAVIDGKIMHANTVLNQRMIVERGWESTNGHLLWELVPERYSDTVRKWYEAIRARGDRFGILETNGCGDTSNPCQDIFYLFRVEERELVIIQQRDRKSLMARYQESEIENEMYRAFARDSNLGMMILGNEGGKEAIIRYASDQAARVLHRTTEDLIGTELVQIIHPNDQRLFLDLYSESQDGRSITLRESIIVVNPDGDRIYLEAWLGPIHSDGTQGSYFLFNDNTSRILLLNELRQFATLFNTIKVMILLTDKDLNIKYINPQTLERLGYGFNEVMGRPITMLLALEDSEAETNAMMEDLIKNGYWIGERTTRSRDGNICSVEMSVGIINDMDKNPDLFVVALRDLTAQKEFQWKETLAREKAEFFLDLLSHDLLNYVQRIIGTLDLLSSTNANNGLDIEALEEVRTQAEGIARIITPVAILSQTRIQDPLKPVDLILIIERVLKDIEMIYSERSIEVEIKRLDDESVYVEADDLLYNLLLNVIDNTIRHSDGNTPIVSITVDQKTEHEANVVRISITDEGPGIKDEDKENVFFKYFRRYDGTEGRGLGLHLVKLLTERYHGNVWIEDRIPGEPNEGAKVVIELKAADSLPIHQSIPDPQINATME